MHSHKLAKPLASLAVNRRAGVRLRRASSRSSTRPSCLATEQHTYGGYCVKCQREHWLPCTPEAAMQAKQLLDNIHAHARLDYESPIPDPRFHLDWLYTKGPGRMLGVLIATDKQGGKHVLKAFSGQITETWHIPGWVGPIAGIINETPVYVKTRRVIERMSARLQLIEQNTHASRPYRKRSGQQQHATAEAASVAAAGTPSQPCTVRFYEEQRQLLNRRRKCLSHHLLQQIQHSYHTASFAGQQLSLVEVYLEYVRQHDAQLPLTKAGKFTGMPAGVGDCCAPKLLHAAVTAGLTPTGLAEVWCGSAPGTATKAKMGRPVPVDGLDPNSSRLHLQMYGMCDKCKAILGTMLCGCPGT